MLHCTWLLTCPPPPTTLRIVFGVLPTTFPLTNQTQVNVIQQTEYRSQKRITTIAPMKTMTLLPVAKFRKHQQTTRLSERYGFFPTDIHTRGCHWFPRLLASTARLKRAGV
jgi:hypothetical protein